VAQQGCYHRVVSVDTGRREHQELLRALYMRGRAAWPAIELDIAAFSAFAAGKLDGGPLDEIRSDDLYLVAGCIAHIEQALIVLNMHYLSPAASRLVRSGYNAAAADDAIQAMRMRLVVDDAGRGPLLSQYNGRGSLAVWIRVAATRMAIGARRKHRNETADEINVLSAEPSPELDLLQRRFGAEFTAAFRSAFAALMPRDRALLRYHVIEQVGIDRIGAIYGVHRATAARWVAHARESLVDGVRRALQIRFGIGDDELDSVLRLVHSKLELSLRLLLTPT
jgi:RNA polymerase sigma-70 factor (ECF subfamily)